MLSGVALEYRFFDFNLKHSAGINAICEGASEDRVLVLNPDTVLTSDCLKNMLATHSPRQIVEARQFPFELVKPFLYDSGACSWVSGACLLIATEDFRTLGGFDAERFPSYCNDVDLCWRGYAQGIECRVATDAFIFHNKLFDKRSLSVSQGTEEAIESKVGYLMMADRYRPQEVEVTVQWLKKYEPLIVDIVMHIFESRSKAEPNDLAALRGFDLFSISKGVFGPTSPLQLHFAMRAFRAGSRFSPILGR